MKNRFKRSLVGLGAAAALVLGVALSPLGATAQAGAIAPPPPVPGTSKTQKPPVPADSAKVKAKVLKSKGKTGARGDIAADADSAVYFSSPLKYCSNFIYLPVVNTSAVTKYYQLQVYTGTDTRNFYSSIAPNSTSYPYFYGISGSFTAYLYVWNGSQYSYDSYQSNSVNCSISVTATKTGGYLLLTVKNNGNTYASVKTEELAPYNTYGTYTGEHWVYPASGGGVAYQYYYVGGAGTRYGVIADVSGSTYNAWDFAGIW